MLTVKRRRKVSDGRDTVYEPGHVLIVLCLSQKSLGPTRKMSLPVFFCCTLLLFLTEIQGKFIKIIILIDLLMKNQFHFGTAQCFGGVETYEKTAGTAFASVTNLQGLVSQPGTAVTRDCAALCKQTATCAAFTVG